MTRAPAREKSVSELLEEYKRLALGAASLAVQVRQEIELVDEEIRDFPPRLPKPCRSRCGARRRDGSPCQAPALFGASRCRVHGGVESDFRARRLEELHDRRKTLLYYLRLLEALAGPASLRR